MKRIHYRNIGFPKTGSTWLWLQFMSHPEVDCKLQMVYKEYRRSTLETYSKMYENYDVTVNLDTHVFINPLEELEDCFFSPTNIHGHTTHLSMTFRNPYEILESMFNMEKNRNPNYNFTTDDFTNLNIGKTYVDMDSFFSVWEPCKLNIRYQFYDDLASNSKQYFEDLCLFLGISPSYDSKIGIKFKTQKHEPLIFENREVIQYINSQIGLIEEKCNRDLSHWKKE
jgi:hypothetical protein